MERANALPSSLRLIKLSSADGHWNGKAVNYSSNTKLAPWRWSGSLQLASWHGVCYYISSSFANSDPLPSTSCANCAARGADPITEIRDFGFYSSSSIRKQSMGRIVMGRGAALWQSLCCKPVLLLEKRKHRIKSLFHQHFYTVKELQSSPHPLLFFFFIGKFLQEGEPTLAESLCWAGTTQRGMCFYSMGNWAGITPDQLSDKSCEKRVAFPGLHLWQQSLMHTEPSRPPTSFAISFHC